MQLVLFSRFRPAGYLCFQVFGVRSRRNVENYALNGMIGQMVVNLGPLLLSGYNTSEEDGEIVPVWNEAVSRF